MIEYARHLTDLLKENSQKFPDKIALVTDESTLSWLELAGQVNQLAEVLGQRLARDAQEVVAILLPNSWQYVVAYLACLEAGHIAMPLDATFKRLEIQSIIDQMPPQLIITDQSLVKELGSNPAVELFDDLLAEVSNQSTANLGYFRTDPTKQIATLLFTSGTTGKPKITAYSHANHLWNPSVMEDLWQWTDQDSLLIALPLSHWHGLVMGIAGSLMYGNTVYLRPRFDAEDVLHQLSSQSISLFMHVPIAYWKLNQVANISSYNLTGVRLWISGSSFLPPAVWHEFKAKYGVEILERYGSSETGLIASNRLDERIPGSVGYVLPGVSIRSAEDGELIMDSPGRFLGYYQNPEATTNNTAADGMWLTGDIGQIDQNGRIVLKGRIQEKIKKLGYTIFPRDVEWAMLQDQHIEDIFVAGIQDPNGLSDTIVYFVVGQATIGEITEYARQHLPKAWRPDIVKQLDELPKTRSGKPKRAALMAMIDQETA